MASKNGRGNDNPAFQIYPQDFWSSPKVQCMKPAEGWVYWRLLCECYRQRGLPLEMDELEFIAMSAGMEAEEFRAAWKRILSRCFVEHDGRLWNPRALREIQHREEYAAECAEAGRKGAKKRWGSQGKAIESDPVNSPDDSPPIATPSKKMGFDDTNPIPSHPNPVVATATIARVGATPAGAAAEADPPSVPPSLEAKPFGIRSEHSMWRGVLDRFLEDGKLSFVGHRVLLDLLEHRCLTEDNPKKLRLPRTEQGWLALAKDVERDVPRAVEALARMQARGGHEFSRHLSWVDADAEAKARAERKESRSEPGSLAPAIAGIRLAEARIAKMNAARRAAQ